MPETPTTPTSENRQQPARRVAGSAAKRMALVDARVAVYRVVRLPCLAMIVFYVPRFQPVFSRMHSHSGLPALTQWLISLTIMNEALRDTTNVELSFSLRTFHTTRIRKFPQSRVLETLTELSFSLRSLRPLW